MVCTHSSWNKNLPIRLYRDGNTVEFRQDPIAKSPYQERIEDDLENELFQASDSEIKHWSDFNRVYYIPRTIQRLPDSAESVNGDWNSGKELFTRYNEVCRLSSDLPYKVDFNWFDRK